jgi:hypothetical protein
VRRIMTLVGEGIALQAKGVIGFWEGGGGGGGEQATTPLRKGESDVLNPISFFLWGDRHNVIGKEFYQKQMVSRASEVIDMHLLPLYSVEACYHTYRTTK